MPPTICNVALCQHFCSACYRSPGTLTVERLSPVGRSIIIYCVRAAALVVTTRTTQYSCKIYVSVSFHKAYPNSESEWRIAEIIAGLLQVLQFNAHEVFDSFSVTEPSNESSDKPTKEMRKFAHIGVAIYQSAAYFNHSCYPAVTRFFVGKTIVLVASRPLKPGEVVAENYGPIFLKQTLSERQRNLRSRYWFACECTSCTENWPTIEHLDDKARLR